MDKKKIFEQTSNMNVDELRRSVESNEKRTFTSRGSQKVLNHLKMKYGTVAAGINVLVLKDMGEL